MLKLLFISLFLTTSACSVEHGGTTDPIASADLPFQQKRSGQLAQISRAFAKTNGLSVQEFLDGEKQSFVLANDDLRIVSEIDGQKLQISAFGSVTPASIELANGYITKATNVLP